MAWSSVVAPRVEIHECVFTPWAGTVGDPTRSYGVGWYVIHVDVPQAFPNPIPPSILGGEGADVVSELVLHCCSPVPSNEIDGGLDGLERSIWVSRAGLDVRSVVQQGRTVRGPALVDPGGHVAEVLRMRAAEYAIRSRGPISGVERSGILSPEEHDLLVVFGVTVTDKAYPRTWLDMEFDGFDVDLSRPSMRMSDAGNPLRPAWPTVMIAVENAVHKVHSRGAT